MRRAAILITLALVTLAWPIAQADPVPNSGIPTACESSPPGTPCKFVKKPTNVIPDTDTLVDGNKTYTGSWTQVGTVIIQPNGVVTFDNASVFETNTSGGILVRPGGTLVVTTSSFTDGGSSTFVLSADAGSTLRVTGSSVVGGNGVRVATSDLSFHGNMLTGLPTALFLDGVTATLTGNTFANSIVGVNQTGGQPTLDGNRFDSNHDCLRDWQTDPTVTNNVFVHCIVGIWHEQSHSFIGGNQMAEDEDPTSVGIIVLNGNSPVLEGNDITDFARGIVVENARAYVRNNTIHGNVGPGIVVDRNSAPMDVQGNRVDGNTGAGIVLRNATSVTLARNVLTRNGGHGVIAFDSPSITFDHDAAVGNAGDGFRIIRSGGSLAGINASRNGGNGLLVDAQQLLAGTNVDCVRAIGNGGHGVVNVIGLHQAQHGWYAENGGAGVLAQDLNTVVDATNSYWGAVTGPRAAANPTGAGDEAQGNVLVIPFLTSPPGVSTCA